MKRESFKAKVYDMEIIIRFPPFEHKHHKVSCGCANRRSEVAVICPNCYTGYKIEALSFPFFRCYSCKKRFRPIPIEEMNYKAYTQSGLNI